MKKIIILGLLLCIMPYVVGSITAGTVAATSLTSGTGVFTSHVLSSSLGVTNNLQVNGTITDGNNVQYVKADGSVPFTGKLGLQDKSASLRNLISTEDVSITVCSSGCNYTTIQDSLDSVPYILKHRYTITVKDGYYNEDIVIHPLILEYSTADEGNIIGLAINGNTSNKNGVIINSLKATGVTGALGARVSYMKINGTEPTSDENTSIAIYGSHSVALHNLNITGNSYYAVMAYASDVYFRTNSINNQTVGAHAKQISTIIFGDSYLNNGNNGTVTSSMVTSSDGSYIYLENNSITGGSVAGNSKGIVVNNGDYIISESVDVNENLNVDSGTFYVKSDTNRVGIGNSFPNASLHITTTQPQIRWKDTSSVNNAQWVTGAKDSNYETTVASSVNRFYNFYNTASGGMFVGINTSSTPTYPLTVNGAIQGNDYYSGDGTQGMTGSCGASTTLTVKDGLITACS